MFRRIPKTIIVSHAHAQLQRTRLFGQRLLLECERSKEGRVLACRKAAVVLSRCRLSMDMFAVENFEAGK